MVDDPLVQILSEGEFSLLHDFRQILGEMKKPGLAFESRIVLFEGGQAMGGGEDDLLDRSFFECREVAFHQGFEEALMACFSNTFTATGFLFPKNPKRRTCLFQQAGRGPGYTPQFRVIGRNTAGEIEHVVVSG